MKLTSLKVTRHTLVQVYLLLEYFLLLSISIFYKE